VDRDSFDRLLLDHLAAAQRFAVRLSGDAQSAEDLLHDAIVRAVKNFSSFRGQSKFTTWLFKIIINCFRQRLRRKPMSLMGEGQVDARTMDPTSASDAEELSRIVAQRISSLPPRQREVLVLIVYERMSITETSQVLGIANQTVRTSLSLARKRLKQELAIYLNAGIRGK
jgi:RNA polymerase sigma-70 factor (ECF subfamily)